MTAVRAVLRPQGCEADSPQVVVTSAGVSCTCFVCGECDQHTGTTSHGHYSSYCKVTRSMRDPHFCCPGKCELWVAVKRS